MKNVNFDSIRYANVWEDAEMLINNGGKMEGKRILSIASAGDNSLSMLAENPKEVVAIDVSHVQLYLTELKALAIKKFRLDVCEKFLGFVEYNEREALYSWLREDLSDDARAYWDAHIEDIKIGVIHQGKFEKYLRLFSSRILPLIHSKATIEELFRQKSEEEQKVFFEEKWNTWRWRALFNLFFSRFVMGRLGRDPEFLKQVKINVSEFILGRSESAIASSDVFDNHILRYCLTGSFRDLRPHYMQEENYDRIKSNIEKLTMKQGLIHSIKEEEKFDFFNLSNIFEYMDESTFAEVSHDIKSKAAPSATYAYWNLMVPRSMATLFEDTVNYVTTGIDKGFFYSAFCLDGAK